MLNNTLDLNETNKLALFYKVKLQELCDSLFNIQFNVDQAITKTTSDENELIEETYRRIRKAPQKYLIDSINNLLKIYDNIKYIEE
jgi:hypothetical protein